MSADAKNHWETKNVGRRKKKKKESNTNLTDFRYQKTALSTVI